MYLSLPYLHNFCNMWQSATIIVTREDSSSDPIFWMATFRGQRNFEPKYQLEAVVLFILDVFLVSQVSITYCPSDVIIASESCGWKLPKNANLLRRNNSMFCFCSQGRIWNKKAGRNWLLKTWTDVIIYEDRLAKIYLKSNLGCFLSFLWSNRD